MTRFREIRDPCRGAPATGYRLRRAGEPRRQSTGDADDVDDGEAKPGAQQVQPESIIPRRAAPGPAIVSVAVIAIRAAAVVAVGGVGIAVGVGRVGIAVIARVVVVRTRIVGTCERGTNERADGEGSDPPAPAPKPPSVRVCRHGYRGCRQAARQYQCSETSFHGVLPYFMTARTNWALTGSILVHN